MQIVVIVVIVVSAAAATTTTTTASNWVSSSGSARGIIVQIVFIVVSAAAAAATTTTTASNWVSSSSSSSYVNIWLLHFRRVQELLATIEKWKRDYIYLLQSCISLPTGDVIDGMEVNLFGGSRVCISYNNNNNNHWSDKLIFRFSKKATIP